MSFSVLIDARKLGDGGIGVYIENLVNGLLEYRRESLDFFKIGIFLSASTSKQKSKFGVSTLDVFRWKDSGVNLHYDETKPYSIEEYFYFAKKNSEVINSYSIYHSPHYTLPIGIKIPKVVTIHDLIHLKAPDTLKQKLFAPFFIRSSIRDANWFLAVSEAGKSDIVSYFPQVKSRTSVVPNAVRSMTTRKSPSIILRELLQNRNLLEKVSGSYFLFVGSDRKHKGFKQLVEAWKLDPNGMPQLLVVGNRFSSEVVSQIANSKDLKNKIIFLGAIKDEELFALYIQAKCLLMPSFEEGYGLPAVEALSLGTPVIASKIDSLSEVCGNSAIYFDSLEPTEILLKIKQFNSIASSLQGKRELDNKIRNFTFLSPIEVGRATVDVYKDILGINKTSISQYEATKSYAY